MAHSLLGLMRLSFRSLQGITLFIALLFLSGGLNRLQAQVICTGDACPYLPLSEEDLNSIFTNLQLQYLDVFTGDMAEAATLANIGGFPLGTVNLQGFSLGASASSGYVEQHDVDIHIPGVGRLDDVPSAGGALNPQLYVGVNLGRLMGLEYDPFGGGTTPFFLSPLRFDLYLNYLDYRRSAKRDISYDPLNGYQIPGQWTAGALSKGVELRYHLLEGRSILGGPLLRFLGVSLGVGYHAMKQDVTFFQNDSDLVLNLTGGQNLILDGYDYARFYSTVESFPVDLRTGVQLFYFLNLTVGGGYSYNRGASSIALTRFGRIFADTDLYSLIPLPDAYLVMNLWSQQSVPARIPFARLGLEFNIMNLKLSVDGTFLRKNKGVNVGLRFEI